MRVFFRTGIERTVQGTLSVLFCFFLLFSGLAQAQTETPEASTEETSQPAEQAGTPFFPIFIFSNEPLPATSDIEEFIRSFEDDLVQDTSDDELAQEGDPVDFRPTEHAAEIEYLENAISRLEEEGGPYYFPLEEEFLELGNLYLQDNLTESAIATYEKSFHINRINLGLYNEKQFEILDNLIRAQLTGMDIRAALENQKYLHHLRTRLDNGDPVASLVAALEYTDWVLNLVVYSHLYNVEINQKYLYFQNMLFDIHENYTAILERIYEQHRDLLYLEEDLLLKTAITHYYLALFTHRYTGDFMSFRVSSETNTDPMGEKPKIRISDSYRIGKRALTARIDNIKRNRPEDTLALVGATLDLGDWYERFQNNFDSRDTYQEVMDIIAASALDNKEELISNIFQPDTPRLIPTFIPVNRSLAGMKLDEKNPLFDIGYLEVNFQIDRYGNASRVELLQTNINSNLDYYFRRLRDNLTSDKIYRPYLEQTNNRQRRDVTFRYFVYGVGNYRDAFVSAVQNEQ